MKQISTLPDVIFTDVVEIVKRTKKALKILEGKTILIAGAAGFLPSYFVHTLVFANDNFFKKRSKIICLDNFRTGIAGRLRPWEGRSDIEFITRDVTNAIKMDGQLDYIIHAASIASPTWYRKFPLETIDVNVIGTRRLLDLAKKQKIKGLLYLSSSEIYGDPPSKYIPTREDYWGNVSSTGPRACYDESKRLAETLCMVYYRQFRIPVKIVRPFNVYGPGLRLDDGRVVPDFINDSLNSRPITVFSDGQATRSFCYIVDAVVAMLLLLTSNVSGESYNVGNDEEMKISKFAKMVDSIAGNKRGVRFAVSNDKAYLTDNPQRRMPDLNKIKKAINWVPMVSTSEGLKRTIEFYRNGEMV